jgi:hypothetical protein
MLHVPRRRLQLRHHPIRRALPVRRVLALLVVDPLPAFHLRVLRGALMDAPAIYALVDARCSDAEILAYAAMLGTGSPWRAIKAARSILNVVRDDQVRRCL